MYKLQWEKLPHGMNGEFVDVSGIGRYMVKPEIKGSRVWRAFLNGTKTNYFAESTKTKHAKELVKDAVRRAVEQHDIDKSKNKKEGKELPTTFAWNFTPSRKDVLVRRGISNDSIGVIRLSAGKLEFWAHSICVIRTDSFEKLCEKIHEVELTT